MYIFIIIFFILTLVHCFLSSRAIISPINIFILIVGFFFSSVFFNPHSNLVYIVYFTILIFINFHNLIILKWVSVNKRFISKHSLKYPFVKLFFLLISIVLVLFIFMNKFGGLLGFVLASKRGTEEFYGLGHYKTIVGMIYPLGLVSYLLFEFNKNKNNIDFICNFLIQLFVIIVALLSLSRGTIINYFISIFLCRYFLGHNYSKITYLALGLTAIVFASFLGVVRETFNFDNESFSLGTENKDSVLKTEWMEFGTFPLEQIWLFKNNDLSYGLTYLTAITNLVPRAYWPNKPDPGGVVFTRDYTNGMYDEFNQYSTGLFPEAMINFGILGGYVVGTFLFFALIFGSSYIYYKLILNRIRIFKLMDVFVLAFYVYFFLSIPALLTGEFTNVVTSLIIKFITLSFFYLFLNVKIFHRKLTSFKNNIYKS